MTQYRIRLLVRAIGGYRLPRTELVSGQVTLSELDDTTRATVEPILAESAASAYHTAVNAVEDLLDYLSLLGEDSAFICLGLEGAEGRNLDRLRNPAAPDQPPPPFESIGGVITLEGQAEIGAKIDPDGSKRRAGVVVVHRLEAMALT